MGLSWLRRDKSEQKNSEDTIWIYPENEQDLEKIFQPGGRTKCIYKHSTTCGICLFAIREVNRVLDKLHEDVDFYYIDVKKDRPLSQKVAALTGVQHESPQILITHTGEVFWHTSHHAIKEKKLMEVFGELLNGNPAETTGF